MDKPPANEKDKEILLQAYQTARAWSSLIVSLATGVILFTAIFKKDIAAEGQPLQETGALLTSWILFGFAALFGVLYLATLIPQLNKGKWDQLDLYTCAPRVLALCQWATFLLGLGFFTYFAVVNLP